MTARRASLLYALHVLFSLFCLHPFFQTLLKTFLAFFVIASVGLAAGLTYVSLTNKSDAAVSPADYASLSGYCSSIPPITSADYASRLSRLSSLVATSGHAAYVMEPGASMLYFGDASWKLSERPFLLVVPADATPFYIAPAFENGTARESIGPDAVLYLWQEDESPYDLVDAHLGSAGSIALDPDTRSFIYFGLAASREVVSGLDLLRLVRATKSSAEMDIMRCANRATKAAIATVAQRLKLGMSEDDTFAHIDAALSAAGLSDRWALVLFGPNAAYPHGTANRVTLTDGMMILIDAGGDLYGYQSDISRTFVFSQDQQQQHQQDARSDGDAHQHRRRDRPHDLDRDQNSIMDRDPTQFARRDLASGMPSADQEAMWNTVRRAQEKALAAIVKGATAGDLDAAARREVNDANDYDTFTHRLGHGIGLQGHEEVYMVKGNDYPLAVGLCFSVEPGVYIEGVGGVRIEDIVCITGESEDGQLQWELFGPQSTSIHDPFKDHI